MSTLPDKTEQIRMAHAALICAVVQACGNRERRPELDQLLTAAEHNGWTALVATIKKILGGDRSDRLLQGLDDEDRVIADAILRGLQDPHTLPDPDKKPDAGFAAPGLAAMLHAARTGDAQALQLLGVMAEQMLQAGGDFRLLSGILRRLVNGERDAEQLSRGMGPRGQQLVQSLVDELAKLEMH